MCNLGCKICSSLNFGGESDDSVKNFRCCCFKSFGAIEGPFGSLLHDLLVNQSADRELPACESCFVLCLINSSKQSYR